MKKRTAFILSLITAIISTGCASRGNNSEEIGKTTVATVVTTTKATTVGTTKTTKATTVGTTTTTKSTTTTTATTTAPTTTTTTAPPTTTTTTTTTMAKKVEPEKKRTILYVQNIQQHPELPMGCEIVSATIALNYYGFNVNKMDMLKYQPMMETKDKDGNWGDPWKVFVGNPATWQYGCYAPVIKQAIEDYWADIGEEGYEVVDLTGSDLTDLYWEIDDGNPVILWCSSKMAGIETGKVSWTLADGGVVDWTLHEHCVCMIGYDTEQDTIIISDPDDSRGNVEYYREYVERDYKAVFEQALVIHKK